MERIERYYQGQVFGTFEIKLNCRRVLRIIPVKAITTEETPYSHIFALQIIRTGNQLKGNKWAVNDGLSVFIRREKMLEIKEAVSKAIEEEEKRELEK